MSDHDQYYGTDDHSRDQHHGEGDGDDDHGHYHHDVDDLEAAVLTVSSTRDVDDDPAGDAIAELLHEAGHLVSVRRVVDDDYDKIQTAVAWMADRGDVNVTVTTSGTGVTPDDRTVEAATQLFEKTLPGSGGLFRWLSYDDIGIKIVGTRVTVGVVDGMPTFCLPGSENTTRLETAEIIVPEAPHLTGLARRDAE